MDIDELWDFGDPASSRRRFEERLQVAEGDEALVLRTQVARTHGLAGDFAAASAELDEIAPLIDTAGPGAEARFWLERGRTLCSAAHDPAAITAASRDSARAAYLRAVDIATAADLDATRVDALHMLAFVDTDPGEQIGWDRAALDVALASTQPAARAWEGSLRNNLGCALHAAGRLEDALVEFTLALAARERGGDEAAIRVARWMVAWTLRGLGRLSEALEIQERLEVECERAGAPDPYVFAELALLYDALGDTDRADTYRGR